MTSIRSHHLAALATAALLALAAGCSTTSAAAPAPANPASSAAATTRPSASSTSVLVDHQSFSSVAEITKKSALVVRGHVTGRTVDLGPESAGSYPRTGHEVVVHTVYKGAHVTRLWVSTPAASVRIAEPLTPYTDGEQVVLFLNDPHLIRDGLGIHATWGLDQGHLTLSGEPGALRPTGHRESLPVPGSVDELEAQIRAAA